MEVLNILTISNCPLNVNQGSGYVIVNSAEKLRGRGHAVDLFGPESFDYFPFVTRARKYLFSINILIFALLQIRKKKYQIIECYGAEAFLAVWVLALFFAGKFLITSHSNGLEPHVIEELSRHFGVPRWGVTAPKPYQIMFLNLFKDFFKTAFTRCDGLVLVSRYERDYALQNNYQSESRVVVVNPGMPESMLGLKIDFSRQPVIGFCGSWLPRKGSEFIAAEISQILRQFPESRFKLIGVGTGFRVENVFDQDILTRIEVVPFVTDREVLKSLYQSISVFIMPSIYESFGLTQAEAMACGCALITTAVGYGADLQHLKDAYVLEKPAAPYLFNAVRELLENESLRLRIAMSGYKRVQDLTWDKAALSLESAYLDWFSKKSA